jgi:hypothetical protein
MPTVRHSGASRNLVKQKYLAQQGQSQNAFLIKPLDSRLHPQGVRRGCTELKPQQRTQRGYDEFLSVIGIVNHPGLNNQLDLSQNKAYSDNVE